MKQTKSRRILALLLSLVMLVSLLPLQAFSEAELTEQTETIMEQTMETDVSDEMTESDDPAADEDEQTDENPVEEGDSDYEELHEESTPTDLDESESEEPDEPAEDAATEAEQQEEPDAEPVTEPDVTPDPADEPEVTPQPSEETEIPGEEADDELLIEPDDPLPQEPTNDVTEEPAEVPDEEPADEIAEQEALPETEPTEELPVDEETEADVRLTIADCISAYGHVYATTLDAAMVFADSAMLDEQHIFIISQAGALLLATAYVPKTDAVKVWFMASDGEILTGYVHGDTLSQTPVTDEQADEMANILWFDYADSEAGTLLVFVVAGEKPIVQEEQPTEEPAMDDPLTADTTEEAEVPETEAYAAAIGDFLYVTTQTRVFMEVDDTAADDYYGDYFLGYFLRDAAVQIEDVLEDSFGRAWYGISYVFGPDEGDGLICELIGHVYVLADETSQTDLTWRTATDYGYPPDYMRPMLLANYYYNLEDHYGGVASFYVGESGLHATTGHDNEYLPIARHDEYGTIFATPHYMKGETAYCLEHTQNSPVVRDHDSGPYTVVDLAGYKVTPGHSGYIFSEKTMHALAWVLRHTYPFMVLDRSDADNDVWCRVAGQFAMREVIKELEGDFYVMYYWEMDEFYRAYDHAPGVYLDYARWLAAEALDYIENFGNITVVDKSVRASGGQYIGTATLYTSADQMRISKSVGTVTGNSGGDDWEYYYLYSGDTVSITSSRSKFSVPIEIIPSADDEALYYVAVTDADIQKLILPVYGDPYPYQAAVLDFEVPHGAASVTKKDAVSGSNLSGATFELLSGSTVIQTLTTGAGGTATFSNLTPGTYTIREKTAPQGYLNASPNTQTVTVTAGDTASVTFTNNRKTSKIRIQKTDQLTGQELAGAEFTITRLSAPAGSSGVGSVAAVITTDTNGAAETGWLEWGRFRITETKVPEDYQDSGYSAEIEAYENGKTYVIDVQNQPIPGYIQLTKTDVNRGTPLSGVQFDIYYNDAYGSGLAGMMMTDADGVARSGALRKGTYQVKEHANPEGYTGELVTMDAIVKPDETTYLSADNQPIQGKIRIQKSDELTGEALAGAEFTITRLSSSSAAGGAGVGETVVLTTDENGVAETGWLDYGTYEVCETKVPVHFVDNSFSQQTALFEHEKTYTLDVENEPTKGFIQLTKTDRLNGNPIKGVRFYLYYNDQYGEGLATSMVTDENGVAISEPIRKGRYIVRESGATVGYFFEEVTLEATVKSDETTELKATNQPVMAKLRIYKRDADEYGGDIQNISTRGDGKLTGAEFQVLAAEDILDRQGNVVHAKGDIVVPSILTEGEDAAALTSDLWPGKYEIVEVTPPAGYAASDEHFFVDASSAADQSEEAVIIYDGLKTNEILYGAKAIVKLLDDDNTDPDPERVETPEEGAEFEVYLASAGSYEDARDLERDYLITDENGYAMTKALPYGMYVLRQTVAHEGYEIKGTEDLSNPPILTITNMPILYRLRLIKTDAETGRIITLANTSFKLKDANGEYVKQMVYYPREQEIDTFTTDETGCVTLPETVTWGLYFIEEVQSPEGYLIRSEDFAVFVGREGDTPDTVYELDIEIPNDPVKGRLRLEKKGLQLTGFEPMTDDYGNEYQQPIFEQRYLAGAVFEVRAAGDIVGRDGTVWFEKDALVDTITTTEEGGNMSKVLPLGKYIVTEVETPAGYVCNPKEYEAELVFADNQTAMVETTVEIENAYLPAEITLLKEKEILQTQQEGEEVRQIVTTTPGEGFVFGLYTDQDIRYSSGTLMADTLVATGVTDEHGSLTFSGLFPHGAYYVRELSAPDGWKLSAERYPVTLDPAMKAEDAHVIRVALDEPIHNELIYSKITLTKTDITGEETLPGAQIEVRNEDGEVIYRAYTDENGEIPDIPVTPGRYTFREIYAPEGYELNETEMQFEVDADGNITGDTTIRDDFTRVQLVKLDENDQPLEGVQFTLSSMDGDILKIEVSDENGLVTFDRIPYGTFVIEESRPLNGYIFTDKKVTVIVTGEFVNPLEPLDTFKNYPNQAVIRKVDQNGKSLEGAVFGLFEEYGIREMTAVSDENGMVRFEKIPHGDYTIREIEAPLGYLLCKEIVNLTVDDSYVGSDTPIATLTNHFKRLRYKKVDTSGKALAGVEFSLINAKTNEIVETVVSDERGEFIFTEFDYGDWIIRETKVPDGYMQMEDITLHVDEGWTEPEPFTCVNVPNTYDFLKVDNRRNPIPGVLFALEDSEGNVIGEFESGEDGVVHVTGLVLGSYVIREIRPADGFTKTDEVIELEIDEKYELPKRMKRIKNYPTIQTGVDLMVTPVMMAGGGLMLIGAVLGVVYGMKKLVRKRRK